MKTQPTVYFEPAASDGKFHCGPCDGADFTLCGFSLDGVEGKIEEVKSKPPRIDCDKCLAIIHYCRGLSARAFHPLWR